MAPRPSSGQPVPRKRHALVVAYDFPPHGAIGTMRTLRVVRQLVEEDWDVTVVTGDPRTFRKGTPVDEALLTRVPESVRIVRAPTWRGFEKLKGTFKRGAKSSPSPAANSGSSSVPTRQPRRSLLQKMIDIVDGALAIPDHESGWWLHAVSAGLSACWSRRPDVLYSSAPPWTGQVVAWTLATLLRCRWVADFRDPWSRAPWREDRFRFAMRAAGWLERRVVRRADHVIFVAQGNRDDFAAAYGERFASRFHVVSNGCDPEEFDALNRPKAAVDPFVLLHAGSLYAGRTPLPLFRAVARAVDAGIVDRTTFRLHFLGAVVLQSNLTEAARELGIADMVEFSPRVPRRESLQAMMAASGLLLLQPGHTVSVPGKLYEYLAAGRPILAIAEEAETAFLVRQSGLGISVTPEDEDGLVAALAQLRLRAMQPVRPVPRELFDGTLKAAQTTAFLAAVADGGTLPITTPESEAARGAIGREASIT